MAVINHFNIFNLVSVPEFLVELLLRLVR